MTQGGGTVGYYEKCWAKIDFKSLAVTWTTLKDFEKLFFSFCYQYSLKENIDFSLENSLKLRSPIAQDKNC